MITIRPEQSVGELVRQRPALATTFERLGLDYCCGGKAPLTDACAKRGLDAHTVIQLLQAADAATASEPMIDADRLSLHELIEHIKTSHHTYLRQEFPMLAQMLRRVVEAHGQAHPDLHRLERVFAAFHEEMEAHMHKEEFVLFPMIDGLESTGESQRFHCGSLRNPIGVMEHEHESAGEAMRRMRELTDDYSPPAEACMTWRALLAGLASLEADMHQHVHKENNILFPKAVAMESALAEPEAAGR